MKDMENVEAEHEFGKQNTAKACPGMMRVTILGQKHLEPMEGCLSQK